MFILAWYIFYLKKYVIFFFFGNFVYFSLALTKYFNITFVCFRTCARVFLFTLLLLRYLNLYFY